MKTTFSKLTLAAGIALALAFTISCSSGGDGGDAGGSSSNSTGSIKIFCQTSNACVEVTPEVCLALEGKLVSNCENALLSSSSVGAQGGSSSSVMSSINAGISSSSINAANYYDPEIQRCQGGIIEYSCGSGWYDIETHYCKDNVVRSKELCGNEYYFPESMYGTGEYRCQGGVIERSCGNKGLWYNELTHICTINASSVDYGSGTLTAKGLCGDRYYDVDTQRCQGGIVEGKCGDIWYNTKTHYCNYNINGTVVNQTITKFELCGDSYYLPIGLGGTEVTARCQGGVVEVKCGDIWYNPITHVCKSMNPDIVTAKEICIGR